MTHHTRTRVDAGRALLTWAVVSGGFGLVCAVTGTPVVSVGSDPAPAWLTWLVVAPAAVSLAAVGLASRVGPRPSVSRLLVFACALCLVQGFGLLMDVLALLFGQRPDSAAAVANHALGMIGLVLLVRMVVTHPGEATAPDTVTRRVRLTGWVGAAAFVPYAAMKTIWALGGTFAGTSGAEKLAISERNGATEFWLTLESRGLDPTALLAGLGVLLLFALIRPWGQVVPGWVPRLGGAELPRWLLLSPAVLGVATLAPYGVIGVGYLALCTVGITTIPRGDFDSSADTLLVGWIGIGAFAVYGVALAVAAHSYWQRTRPEQRALQS